jgi:hypothetical protein
MNARTLFAATLIAVSLGSAQAADTGYQTYLHTLDAANPAPGQTTAASAGFEHGNVDTFAYQIYQHTLDAGNAVDTNRTHPASAAPAMNENVPSTPFRNIDLH